MKRLRYCLLGYTRAALSEERKVRSDIPVYYCEEPQLAPEDSAAFQRSFGLLAHQIPDLLGMQEFAPKMLRTITYTSKRLCYREQHPLATARKLRELSQKKLAQLSGVLEKRLWSVEQYSLPLGSANADNVIAALCLAPEHKHPVFRRRILLRLSIPECGVGAATMWDIVSKRKTITLATMNKLILTLSSSAEKLGFTLDSSGLYAQRGLKHTVLQARAARSRGMCGTDSPSGTGL